MRLRFARSPPAVGEEKRLSCAPPPAKEPHGVGASCRRRFPFLHELTHRAGGQETHFKKRLRGKPPHLTDSILAYAKALHVEILDRCAAFSCRFQ